MSRYYRVSRGERLKDICSSFGIKTRDIVEYNFLPTLDLFEDQVILLPSNDPCQVRSFLVSLKVEQGVTNEFVLCHKDEQLLVLFLDCGKKFQFRKVKSCCVKTCKIDHQGYIIQDLIEYLGTCNMDVISRSNLKCCSQGKGLLIWTLLYGAPQECSSTTVSECSVESMYKTVDDVTYTIYQLQHDLFGPEGVIWR